MRNLLRRLAGLLTVWLAAGAQTLAAADGNFAVVSNPGDAPALLEVVINGEKTAVAMAAGQWVLISEATASADGFACTLYFPESHLLREDLMDVRIQIADTRRLSFSYSPFAVAATRTRRRLSGIRPQAAAASGSGSTARRGKRSRVVSAAIRK